MTFLYRAIKHVQMKSKLFSIQQQHQSDPQNMHSECSVSISQQSLLISPSPSELQASLGQIIKPFSDCEQSSILAAKQGIDSLSISLQQLHQLKLKVVKCQQSLKKKLKDRRNSKKRFGQCQIKNHPSFGLLVYENLLQITYSQINQYSDCALIIPLIDTKMEIYPGSIIENSEIDYKKQIESNQVILNSGSVLIDDNWLSQEYMYHCIGFVKINERFQDLEKSLDLMFQKFEKLQKNFAYINRLVIPLSMFTYHQDKYEELIKKIIYLMKNKKFRSVQLTTEDKEEWNKISAVMLKILNEMIDSNKIDH